MRGGGGGSMGGEKLTCIDRYAHPWNRRRSCKRRWKRHCWEYMRILCEWIISFGFEYVEKGFQGRGGFLTSPVVSCVSHDQNFFL